MDDPLSKLQDAIKDAVKAALAEDVLPRLNTISANHDALMKEYTKVRQLQEDWINFLVQEERNKRADKGLVIGRSGARSADGRGSGPSIGTDGSNTSSQKIATVADRWLGAQVAASNALQSPDVTGNTSFNDSMETVIERAGLYQRDGENNSVKVDSDDESDKESPIFPSMPVESPADTASIDSEPEMETTQSKTSSEAHTPVDGSSVLSVSEQPESTDDSNINTEQLKNMFDEAVVTTSSNVGQSTTTISPSLYSLTVSDSNYDIPISPGKMSFRSDDDSSNEEFQSASSQDVFVNASNGDDSEASSEGILNETLTVDEEVAQIDTSVYSAEKLLASALGLIDDDKLNDSRVDEGVYEELEERNSNADTESLPDVPVSPHNDDVNLPTKFSESIDDDDDDESVPIITTCFKDSMNGFTSAFVSDDEKQPLHSQKEEDLEASKEVDTDERDSKATLVNKDAEEGNHEDEDVQDDVAEEGQGLEVKLENDSSHENADMDELVHKAVPEGVDEVRSAKNVALDAVVQDDNVDEGISEDKDVNEETVEKETVPEAVPENVMIQGVRLGEQVVRDDVLNNEDSYDASKDILEDSGEDNDVHEAVPEVKITPVEPPKDQVIHEAVPVKRDNDTGSDGNKHVAEPVSEGAAIKESPPKGDTITQVLPGETVLHQNPEPPSIEAPLHEAPSKSEAHFREQTSRNAPPKIEFKDNEPPTAFGSFAQGFSASNSPSRYSISSTSTTSTPSKDSRSSKYGRHSREKPIYPKRSTSYRSVDEFAKKGMAVMNPLKNEFQLPSVPIFKKSTVPCASPFKTDKHVTAKFPDVHKLYCKKPQFTLGRSIPVLPPSDDDLVVLSSRTSREFSAPAKVYTYNHDECSFDLQQYSGTLRVVEDQQYSGERHTHVAIFKKTDVGGQECAFQVPISMQTVFRLVTSMSCVIDTVVDSEKYTFIIRFHKVGASKKFHDAVMLAKYFLFISTRTAKN